MAATLLTVFPNPSDLLALEPEELGGVVLELVAGARGVTFAVGDFTTNLYRPIGPTYPNNMDVRRAVELAVAEAMSWLQTEGLIVLDPTQPDDRYVVTRRGRTLRNRAEVEVYRRGRILPIELLQPELAEKVWPLFLRGDHDTAVFQAFKEIEMAVRRTSNAKGAGYADDLVGVGLMSTITLSDGFLIAACDGLPASASRVL